MRILYVAMEHDYGDPARGPSFEETNFRSALEGMGNEVLAFDFMEREKAVGRKQMNADLLGRAAEVRPDVSFFFLHEDEIAPSTIEGVSREGGGPTVNWFADDHWRFEGFTRHFAPAFDWCVTTDHESLPRYRAIGYDHVIQSQWACNRYAYTRTAERIEHQVTFVGQSYGERPKVVAGLRDAGYEVECWGQGWPGGRIEHEQMVRLFGASAINLNLSSSFRPRNTLRMRLGALARGIKLDTVARRSQIKGRTFEVPGSGGFLLTDAVPHLEEYLEPGREIGVFSSTDDLIEQVGYWTSHEAERAAVAQAGYRRVLAEHTYDHRFAEIFAAVGVG
jgi:spore maturation protein CgeB